MVRAGCVFVAGIHPSRTWTSGSFESVRWNACMHRLDLGLYSHPKEFFGEWSWNPCYLQGKNPLYQKISQRRIEPATLWTVSPNTTYELFQPLRGVWLDLLSKPAQCSGHGTGTERVSLLRKLNTSHVMSYIWAKPHKKCMKLLRSLMFIMSTVWMDSLYQWQHHWSPLSLIRCI